MIWNEKQETMAREDLAQLQLERLQATLNRVERNVAFYRQAFAAQGVRAEDVRELADIARLPFTTKEDLRKSYPYDMFAVPLRDIVRIHSTSGTTGKPIVVGYTRNDIRTWSECVARVLAAGGMTDHDVVQVAFPYGLFSGGLGFHYGAERIGASVIPASAGSLEKQILIMRDFKTTALACTPSYALAIASALDELGIHPQELFLRSGFFGAEPWSESLRSQLEEKLHVTALDNYGLTEVVGPGSVFRMRGPGRAARERGPLHRRNRGPEDPHSRAPRAPRASSCSPPSPRKASPSFATAPGTWAILDELPAPAAGPPCACRASGAGSTT